MDKKRIKTIKAEDDAVERYEYSDPDGRFTAGAETKEELVEKVEALEGRTK